MKRDENGVVIPIKTTAAPAESVPPVKLKKTERPKKPERQESDSGKDKKKKPIGQEEISNARTKLSKFMSSKKTYDVRYKNNFDTYNLLYTQNNSPQIYIDDENQQRNVLIPKRTGAQCLNVIMNKHADAMDNYPEPFCLPRAGDDEKTAETLNAVLPCVLERNGFKKVYSNATTDKLVGGCCGYWVTWDTTKENGLGDVAVSKADLLNVFWEPHIEDIQESSDLFNLKYYDIERVKEIYPEFENITAEKLGAEEYTTFDSSNKQSDKAVVIDWYYKKGGKLHFVKFCGETILASTENNPGEYPNGLYEHGRYPLVLDPLFPLRDTPVGFSFVDVCRAPQAYLDDLKVDILKNVKVNSQPRTLANEAGGINSDDLADLSKVVVKCSTDPRGVVQPIETKGIAAGALNVYNSLIEEIKETTGTNDASNGASAAGVTSGSAIAALQEAGGKISRDSNKQSYLVFVEVCNFIIELMRQFYTLPRFFRIKGEDNKPEYIEFDNSGLIKKDIEGVSGEFGEIFQRLPIFDIDVKAQKSSPFATAAQNEMMMQLFKMGAFNPETADASLIMLEGMSFEGKEKVIEKVKENQTLLKTVQEMSNKMQMLEAMNAQKNAESVQAEIPSPAQGNGEMI